MIVAELLLLFGVVVALIAPRIAQKRVLGVREKISDSKLVELFSSSLLPAEALLALLKQIGACYGIAYSQLRPDDCFISRLSKIDSWRFDAGAEKLGKSLQKKFGVTIPDGLKSFTILDLLKLVEKNLRANQNEPTGQP